MNLRNNLSKLKILSIYATSFLFLSFTHAATYYVSTSGSNSNEGTLTKPFKTIQRGLDLARAGDTVLVRGGTYAGSVTFKYSGASGKPITLRNYSGERAIIDQGSSYTLTRNSNDVRRVTLASAAGTKSPVGWIVIEGLEIARGWDGIKMYNAHDVIIRGCNIHHSLSQGVLGNGLRVTLDRNIIANNGNAKWRGLPADTNQLHGVYLTGSNHKIINNVIHSNLGSGIQVAGYPMSSAFFSTEYSGARNWLIANNTFAYQKNRGGLIIWQSEARYATIINNIFYENATAVNAVNGVQFYGAGPGNILKNNLFYSSKNRVAISSTSASAYTSLANLLQVKPLFQSASGYNFRLLASSPGVNKGLKTSSVLTDFDKKTRPRGTTHDIGAFEY